MLNYRILKKIIKERLTGRIPLLQIRKFCQLITWIFFLTFFIYMIISNCLDCPTEGDEGHPSINMYGVKINVNITFFRSTRSGAVSRDEQGSIFLLKTTKCCSALTFRNS